MMLEATRGLVVPPATNTRLEGDVSSLLLLAQVCERRVVLLGTAPPWLAEALREIASPESDADTHGAVPRSDDPDDPGMLVIAAPDADPADVDKALQRGSVAVTHPQVSKRLSGAGTPTWWIPALTSNRSSGVRRLALRIRARARRLQPGRRRRDHAADLTPRTGERLRRSDWAVHAALDWRGEVGPAIAGVLGLPPSAVALRRFSPPRGFASQKVMLEVEAGGDALVVKMSQHERFNHRLAAEHEALAAMSHVLDDREATVPTPVASAHVCGRLLIAQTHTDGVPLRRVASPDPGGEGFRTSVEALTSLGRSTSASTEGDEVHGALSKLVDAHVHAYGTPAEVEAALRSDVEIAAAGLRRSVAMHGDPGMWNILQLADGRIALLDWENFDAHGVPLWDLAEFARSFAVFTNDLRGRRTPPAATVDVVLRGQGDLGSAVRSVLSAAAEDVGLDDQGADALLTLFFVQQAVREAATVASPRWPRGRHNTALGNIIGSRS